MNEDIKTILVTGGAGFIGHHFIEHVLKTTNWKVISIDRLDVSGNLHRFTDMQCWAEQGHRVKFLWHDLRAPISEWMAREIGEVEYIVHFAASSHVDRSIEDPMLFVMDNVVGTTNLLNFIRNLNPLILERVINFSTDEVFGAAPVGVNYKEWDRFNPGNPYAASKAGQEAMVDAFANTYRLPLITTHTMNVFGERQHPEKFIPMTIRKVLNGESVTIHANKDKTESGTRFYIHARNVSAALMFLLEKGETLNGSGNRGKYNIVGDEEVSNLAMAQAIADIVGKPLYYDMVDFHSSRPGHDLRYALDGTLLKELGWNHPKTFKESLESTVKWTLEHPNWINL